MYDKRIFNFVCECKDKLFVNSELFDVIDVQIIQEVGEVLKLEVMLESECEIRTASKLSVHKETAYNYSRSKLLKKLIEKTKNET